jgi:hypothetical protein
MLRPEFSGGLFHQQNLSIDCRVHGVISLTCGCPHDVLGAMLLQT